MSLAPMPGERMRGLRLLCTAATRGIGFAVARRAAAEGARVVLTGSSEGSAAEAAQRLRAEWPGAQVEGLWLDVADAASIRAGVDRARQALGGIDALFANVPGARPGALAALQEDDWQRAFELYLLSFLRLMAACRADLAAAGPGRALVVTSYAAVEAIPGLSLSNVLRPAVHALVRELARAHAGDGILVNAIAPGRVDTERVRAVDAAAAHARGVAPAQVRGEAEAAIPLGRYAEPDELARQAIALMSRENTYVTGQCLVVDGGLVRSP